MAMKLLRSWVTSRPGWVVAFWVASAGAVGLCAPNLTRLAAEGQAHLAGEDAESLRASEALRRAWPDQAYESLAVAALHRAGWPDARPTSTMRDVWPPGSRGRVVRRRCCACSGRTRRRKSPGGW